MAEPVRVLYEIHPHIVGGAERFLIRFLERLNQRLYEPIVVSQKMGKPLQHIHSLGVRTEVMPGYFKATGVRQLAEYIRLNSIRLVQSNYYSSNLATASNLAGVPHIWRLGGHVSVGSGGRNGRDAQWVLDIIRLLSKAIICNSDYVRSQFRNGSGRPPIKVIPNGIPVPASVPRKKRRNGFRIGMVAHFTPQKRHIDFIRAAELVSRSLENVSFSILGCPYDNSSSRSYMSEIKRRSQRLCRQGKLSFSEYVEAENDTMGEFDMIVLPSVRESFSNAVLEAMAAGIPVIAAHSGGNPELVEHRKTGLLVPPMRAEALAQAISLLIENPRLTDRMGEAARKRALARFPIDDCVRSYEAVYSEVLFDSGKR